MTKKGTPFTIEGHVSTGSRAETPYISSFTNKSDVFARAASDGGVKVIEIDLLRVNGKLIDLSNETFRNGLLKHERARNFAKKSSEFLIVTDEILIDAYKIIN